MGGGGGSGSAAPSPLPARGGGGGWGVLHPIESACGEGGACGGACGAQSPSMEVAARIALATIGERGDDGGALGPLLGREGGGGGGEEGGEEGEGACAISARKQRRTSPHDAAGGGGGGARLPSSFQQVKPLGPAAAGRPPLAGRGQLHVRAGAMEVGFSGRGGRGRVPGSAAGRDLDVYCSPLLGGGEGAGDEEFEAGCAHAERAVGRVDDVFAIV